MNWWMLAVMVVGGTSVFLLVMLVERCSRRRFRAHMTANAQARWDIIASMPPGEARERLALLHTRVAEITDRLWDDLYPIRGMRR